MGDGAAAAAGGGAGVVATMAGVKDNGTSQQV